MESQPKNPEIRINPENFYPCRNSFQVSEKMRKNKSVFAFKMECNNNRKQFYVHYFFLFFFSLLSSRQTST